MEKQQKQRLPKMLRFEFKNTKSQSTIGLITVILIRFKITLQEL